MGTSYRTHCAYCGRRLKFQSKLLMNFTGRYSICRSCGKEQPPLIQKREPFRPHNTDTNMGDILDRAYLENLRAAHEHDRHAKELEGKDQRKVQKLARDRWHKVAELEGRMRAVGREPPIDPSSA